MNFLLRIIIFIICIFTFINALIFVGLSIGRSIAVYKIIIQGDENEHSGLHLAESLDGFLLAIIFLIFAIGIGKLFIPDMKILQKIRIPWLEPKSFAELKHNLWLAVLTTLVVLSTSSIVQNIEHLTWNLLIIPSAVLLIAIGLKALK